MATLGGVEIEVVFADEADGSVKATTHPVEKGIDITDHVKPDADIFNINGLITGPNAASRRQQIVQMMKDGEVIKYLNRLALSNVIIKSFNTVHDAKVKGGMRFTATLEEVRFAQVTTVKENPTLTGILSNLGLQQPVGTVPEKIYTPKNGETITQIAKKENVNADKLYEKNRHVVSSRIASLSSTNKIVIPTI